MTACKEKDEYETTPETSYCYYHTLPLPLPLSHLQNVLPDRRSQQQPLLVTAMKLGPGSRKKKSERRTWCNSMDGFIWTTRCLQKENTSLFLFLKDLQSRPRTRQMGYNKQRIHYRNKDLSVEQIFLLTSIGFVWDFRGNRDGMNQDWVRIWCNSMDGFLWTACCLQRK